MTKGFASDNYAGVHPQIFQAMQEANVGHSKAYGNDPYTRRAKEVFKKHFGEEADVYFVCNGTAANVLSLSAVTLPYQAIICADSAHLNVDECGAPEKYIGSKLLTIPSADGKLTVDGIRSHLNGLGDQHKVQPRVISISQSTEFATVYSVEEIKKITAFARENGLLVHMDGSRLCNAAASLGLDLASLTKNLDIDLLSFGGTKNGMMMGEAVVFFKSPLSRNFQFIRKQGMQLLSKLRFISAQFYTLLESNLWLKNARHANAMAKLLEAEIRSIPQIRVTQEVQANAVFAQLPPTLIFPLQQKYDFYVWNESTSEVRWMTSWDTTVEDIRNFVQFIKQTVAAS